MKQTKLWKKVSVANIYINKINQNSYYTPYGNGMSIIRNRSFCSHITSLIIISKCKNITKRIWFNSYKLDEEFISTFLVFPTVLNPSLNLTAQIYSHIKGI